MPFFFFFRAILSPALPFSLYKVFIPATISRPLRTSTSRAFPVPFIFLLGSSAGCHPAFGSAFGLFTCRWLLFEPCGFAAWSARIVPLAASSFCISRAYLREPLHQAVYFSALPRRASLSSVQPDAILSLADGGRADTLFYKLAHAYVYVFYGKGVRPSARSTLFPLYQLDY